MNKIKIILLLVGLFYANVCFAQSGWFWQNPLPTGVSLNSSYFVNDNTGYVIGNNGVILKTSNGGLNFSRQNSNSNYLLTSIFFVNDNTGYAAGIDGTQFSQNSHLLKTNNGGIDWTLINYGARRFNSLYFTNEFTGYIIGSSGNGGVIYKTTDGGNSLVTQGYYPYVFILNSLYFVDTYTGFAVGDFNILAKTINSGMSWDTLRVGSGFNLRSVYFINNQTGYVAGTMGKVFKSTNAGQNWFNLNTGKTTGLNSIAFLNSNSGFAAGANGVLIKTTNSGANWDSVMIDVEGSNLSKVTILSSSKIIINGNNGAIWKSTDQGNTWNKLSNRITRNDMFSICFIEPDNRVGYCLGDSTFLKTTDYGVSWEKLTVDNYRYRNVNFLNENTGFISGGYVQFNYPTGNQSYSKIFKTTNGGVNWILKHGNGDPYIYDKLLFVSPLIGWGAGNSYSSSTGTYSGALIKTTNSGENWLIRYIMPYTSYYDIQFTSIETGYACGHNVVVKTTDSGSSWFAITPVNNKDYLSIYFHNSINGYISSVSSIHKTTNGGINWTNLNINIGESFEINSIKFLNEQTGYAVGIVQSGRNSQIVKTTNAGNNWVWSYSPTLYSFGFHDVCFTDINTGYIIGEKGAILKTTIGGEPIGIENISSELPDKHSLSQNYPNPFNPQTKIKFDVPANVKGQTSNVKLIIYDMLGREVTTLVNDELKPGTYEADWEGSNYSSGVYFYKLVAADFVETKKMVLMR